MKKTTENDQIKGTTLSLFQFALLLIVSSAVVRLASSLYLPSLVEIGKSLHLSETTLSSTLTIFFIAFALSTLFAGPFADHYGRKKVILGGFIIFIAGSLICAFAFSATSLFAGRILQAAGASCIPVAGRAMIRDLCSDIQVVMVLGWMAAIGGLVPIVAPMFGGLINDTLGWHYNFLFLVLFSVAAFTIVGLKLPRSLKPESARALHLRSILKTYYELLFAPEFIIVIFPLALAFAIQGAYMGLSPFIFMKRFGLSATQYGFANLAVVMSLVAGRYIATGLTKRFSAYTAYVAGGSLTFFGGVLLMLIIYLDFVNLASFLLAVSVAVAGFGTLLPIGVKSIMTAFRDRAGTVSALHGCLTLGMASVGCFVGTIIKHNFQLTSLTSLAFFLLPLGFMILTSGIFTKKYLR